MKRAVITGLGFITSIGNDSVSILDSLKTGKSGIELFDEFADDDIPIKLAGTIKDFSFPTPYFEDWEFPKQYKLTREQLRPMAPNSVYAYCAMCQAVEDAKLPRESFEKDPRTSLMCASGGSMWMAYNNLHTMQTQGVQRTQPMGIINSIPGSLYINLGAIFKIQGGTLGFSSACSSSAHAMGAAYDLIAQGKQDRVFVVGAEDCNKFSILPFASVRALSPQKDPKNAPRAFDKKRDGFVGTGGGCVMVMESLESAQKRKASVYAEMIGWAQSSDGFNVLAPETNGEGLARCMKLAMESTNTKPQDVDYINAHATATTVGDTAEARAVKSTFPESKRPLISSTKSLTGHGLSLAGVMEASFCCLNLKEKFVPVSANITELDPECEGIPVITEPTDHKPKLIMSNSSGFGGTNVSILLKEFKS